MPLAFGGNLPLPFFMPFLEMLVLWGGRFFWVKSAGADGRFDPPSLKPPARAHLLLFHLGVTLSIFTVVNSLPLSSLRSPAYVTGDALWLLPGWRHMGDAGNCLVFLWGEEQGSEAQGGESPARWLPVLPAVFGGWGSPGSTGGICPLPFCLARATVWS